MENSKVTCLHCHKPINENERVAFFSFTMNKEIYPGVFIPATLQAEFCFNCYVTGEMKKLFPDSKEIQAS